MPNTSPNMALPIPIPGVDSGLVWENSLVSCLTLIDQHMHAPGYGVIITPSGLSINQTFVMNNQLVKQVGAMYLTQNAAPLASSQLSVLYSGNGATGDLYFNDGAGNQIKITSGGAVNATSSGITSGTASASFSSGVLVVNAAATTPANIQAGSILLGNNVANSKFLTLSPPAAMAANFTLTLPSVPGATSIVQLDASGNFSASNTISNSVTLSANLQVNGTVTIGSGGPVASYNSGLGVLLINQGIQIGSSSFAFVSAYGDDRTLTVGNAAGTISDPIVVGGGHGSTHGLNIIRGVVDSNGSGISGEGFSISHPATGVYTLTFATAFFDVPAVTASIDAGGGGTAFIAAVQPSSSAVTITTFNLSGVSTNSRFDFIATGQR